MDYFQDVVPPLVLLLRALSHPKSAVLEQAQLVPLLQLLPLHEMPSRHQDLHRALLPILLQVRDPPLHSFWQRSF